MGRRDATRRRTGGGDGISPTRATRNALTLGAASLALAGALAGWLALAAGADASRPVAGIGAGALVVLLATLAVGRPEGVVASLGLLGGAYAVILALDAPPLDARAAVVAAALLATGELAHLSLDARSTVATEPGVVARRVGSVALFALLALGLGGLLLVLVDLLRTGGLVVEAVGVAAVIAAVGMLVVAARETGGGGE